MGRSDRHGRQALGRWVPYAFATAVTMLEPTLLEAQDCVGVEGPGSRAIFLEGGALAGRPRIAASGQFDFSGPLSLLGGLAVAFPEGGYGTVMGGRLVVVEPYETLSLCFLGGLDLIRVDREIELPDARIQIRHGGIRPALGAGVGRGVPVGQARLTPWSAAEVRVPMTLPTLDPDFVLSLDVGLTASVQRYLFGAVYSVNSSDRLIPGGEDFGLDDGVTFSVRVGIGF